MTRARKYDPQPGERYGKLVVTKKDIYKASKTAGTKPYRAVEVRCDCGRVFESTISNLCQPVKGITKCMKCAARERSIHNLSGTVVYDMWQHNIITTPDRFAGWDNPKDFSAWVNENLGPKPEGLVFSRIDQNRPWEPGNVHYTSKTAVQIARHATTKTLDQMQAHHARLLLLAAQVAEQIEIAKKTNTKENKHV